MKQEQTFNSRAVLISALLLGLVWHFTFSYGSSIALWQSNPAALTQIQTMLTEISLFCQKFCPVLLPSAFLAFFCFGSQWLINSYELLRERS